MCIAFFDLSEFRLKATPLMCSHGFPRISRALRHTWRGSCAVTSYFIGSLLALTDILLTLGHR